MGASSSIDSMPLRHIHISYSKDNSNLELIHHLINKLNTFDILKTTNTIDNNDENLIMQCEIILLCIDKSIIKDFNQLNEVNLFINNSKKIIILDMEKNPDKNFYPINFISKFNHIEFNNINQLNNIENHLKENFAKF